MITLTFISLSEAAKRIGVHRDTLRRLIANGDGPPAIRIGRRIMVQVSHFHDWLGKRTAVRPNRCGKGA
ncbi:helix-turn-helix transcriptional regulator [Komagataeibacter europaeus]|uniref:helix-turn-helix transcriptional regulator n=1 Tax=Komagataeibacter europaeus TaxID=33995 RepID=UPI000585AF09